ncbi:MAG TPA: hypothetical protein PLM79_17700 [Syntrophobacteraceae bacterium]|nr:hypothetical protein [Syntrophobacteraceae bacterium]
MTVKATRKPPAPLIIGPGWYQMQWPWENQRCWQHRTGLRVIQEIEIHDGKEWLHTSFSRPDRIPSYQEITVVKDQFIGTAKKAIMVFPPREEHVNVHPFCLHLYSCLAEDGLPDFRRAGGGL